MELYIPVLIVLALAAISAGVHFGYNRYIIL